MGRREGLAFFETSALPPGTKAEAPFRWWRKFPQIVQSGLRNRKASS